MLSGSVALQGVAMAGAQLWGAVGAHELASGCCSGVRGSGHHVRASARVGSRMDNRNDVQAGFCTRIGGRDIGHGGNGRMREVRRDLKNGCGLRGQALKVCEAQGYEGRQRTDGIMIFASSTGGRDLYQPFRPPPQPSVVSTPSPGGVGAGASIEEQLQILRDRQGLWFVYAKVIPSLFRAGFSPSEIDELTGLNGHEQNQLVVGAQVRDSLVASGFDSEGLSWFDVGGADRLYELRILSAQERKAAAYFVVERNMDAKLARDLARSVKDFPRRKSAEGFSHFSNAPGDCLAFALYMQSKETTKESEVESILEKALEFVVTEKAKSKLMSALKREDEVTTGEHSLAMIKVLVMRLSSEKVPVVLPVADFSAGALAEAPSCPAFSFIGSNSFNILRTSVPWKSWIAIPSWKPISVAVSPVALLVPDGNLLPKGTGIVLTRDPILVVVDKGVTEIGDDSFFLVNTDGGLTLIAGPQISTSQTVLGKVLIALKPPLALDPNNVGEW